MFPEIEQDTGTKTKFIDDMPLCPLMNVGSETPILCAGENCAWFVQWRGQHQCAVKVLAHAAIKQANLREE